jgi:serine protease Do
MLAMLAGSAVAQQSAGPLTDASLQALSDGFETLAERATPAVVQIVASGYGPIEDGNSFAATVARQRGGGSGVILDPNGYIITNAHVVDGDGRVQVLLASRRTADPEPRSILKPRPRLREAKVLGVDVETDLAVLRIDEVNLPSLELADSDTVRQGQIVFAFGSPLGLENTVTMGVVSSSARQLEPDHPMIYIQTDSAINPGNSGGPLLNVEGEVIGINTLILSQSGGNEGVGFAVPSNIVWTVYKQLRDNGVVRRGAIGVTAQTITPLLAAGLGLSRDWGVILGDVRRRGPGEIGGLQVGDIVLSLNGKLMENARQFRVNIYQRTIGDVVRLEVLRGDETHRISVAVLDLPDGPARFSGMVTRQENLVSQLGILAIDLTEKLKARLPPLRKPSGVLVAALVADGPYWKTLFEPGDVIYSVNRKPTRWLDELRDALANRMPGDPVVVQLERRSRLLYVTFEME